MFTKASLILATLISVNSNPVNAEINNVAYADGLVDAFQQNLELSDANMATATHHHQYRIQSKTSHIEFRVDSPIGEISASFQEFGGSFSMADSGDREQPASINVNTGSLDTDAGFIAIMLKSESFFDVEKFPSMQFEGTDFKWVNQRCAILTGAMTIKGVTREVNFYVELVEGDSKDGQAEQVSMKATANIKRSEFDIYSLLPLVSDDVNLYVSIDAVPTKTSVSMLP